MKSRICIICRKEFEPTNPGQKCCSEDCSKQNIARKNHEWYRRKIKPKKCKMCGKEFMPSMELKVYCSVACQMKTSNAPRAKIKGVCPGCGQEFWGRKGKMFCTESCRSRYRRAENSDKPYIPQEKTEPKIRVSHINEINAQARAKGLSYGQFKALQYMQAHKYDKW